MLVLNLRFAEVKIFGDDEITYTVFYQDFNDDSFNSSLVFSSWDEMKSSFPTITDLLNEIGCIKYQQSKCVETPSLFLSEGMDGLYTEE